MWKPQLTAHSPDYLVLAPDLRGYGKNPLPDGPFSDQRDILAILDRHGLERALPVGASFGSRLATHACLQSSYRVEGMVLISPFLSGFTGGEAVQRFNEQEGEFLEQGDLEAATELNMCMWVDGPYREVHEVDQLIRSGI